MTDNVTWSPASVRDAIILLLTSDMPEVGAVGLKLLNSGVSLISPEADCTFRLPDGRELDVVITQREPQP